MSMVNENNKVVDIKKHHLKRWPKLISKKMHESQVSFWRIVDDLEQFLGEKGIDDIPAWDLTPFSVLKEWHKGKHSSYETWEKLESIDLEKSAYNKVVSKVGKYYERYLDKKDRNPEVLHKLRISVDKLKTETMPIYLRYLKGSHKYLEKLYEVDEKQLPVLHGRVDRSGKYNWREITLNQAVNYIKYNKIAKDCDEKYLMHHNTLTFEKHFIKDESQNGNTQVKETNWFIATDPYIKTLSQLFRVNTKVSMSVSNASFYETIEKSLENYNAR